MRLCCRRNSFKFFLWICVFAVSGYRVAPKILRQILGSVDIVKIILNGNIGGIFGDIFIAMVVMEEFRTPRCASSFTVVPSVFCNVVAIESCIASRYFCGRVPSCKSV